MHELDRLLKENFAIFDTRSYWRQLPVEQKNFAPVASVIVPQEALTDFAGFIAQLKTELPADAQIFGKRDGKCLRTAEEFSYVPFYSDTFPRVDTFNVGYGEFRLNN